MVGTASGPTDDPRLHPPRDPAAREPPGPERQGSHPAAAPAGARASPASRTPTTRRLLPGEGAMSGASTATACCAKVSTKKIPADRLGWSSLRTATR